MKPRTLLILACVAVIGFWALGTLATRQRRGVVTIEDL